MTEPCFWPYSNPEHGTFNWETHSKRFNAKRSSGSYFQNGLEFWREHPQVFQLKNAEAKVRLRETLPINPSTRDVERMLLC